MSASPRRLGNTDRRDGGQVMPLVLAMIALALLAAAAIGRVGGRTLGQQRAVVAADAAALAGVVGGEPLAAMVAARNGGRMVRFQRSSGSGTAAATVTVTVSVVVDGFTATARATNGP